MPPEEVAEPVTATENLETPVSIDPKDQMIAMLEQQLRQRDETSRAFEERFNQLESTIKTNVPKETVIEDAQAFFAKPHEQVRDIVRREIAEAVAPLKEFTQSLGRESAYDKLKNTFRNDAQFKDIFPEIEGAVDTMVSKQKGEINQSTMMTIVLSAIGAKHVTGGFKPTSNEIAAAIAAPTAKVDSVTPPHLRPAPPRAPAGNQGNEKTYSENEKRLMREQGFTPAQWEAANALNSNEVTTFDKEAVFGKKAS